MAIVYKQYMPTPTASQTITSNGTYNVVDKASAVVNVPTPEPDLVDITITENGTYTHSGHDGYDEVTVSVPTGTSVDVIETITAIAMSNVTKGNLLYVTSGSSEFTADPNAQISVSSGTGTAFSPDGTRCVAVYSVSPYMSIYDTTTSPWSLLTNPSTLPTGAAKDVAFNPSGTRCVVSQLSNSYFIIYDTTTSPWSTLTAPSTMPSAYIKKIAFHPSGTLCAMLYNTSPSLIIYDTTTLPWSVVDNPSILPNAPSAITFNSSGTLFAIIAGGGVMIYDASVFPWVYLPNIIPYISGNVTSIAFNPLGTRCVLPATDTYSYVLNVYDTTTSPWTLMKYPSPYPSSSILDVAISPSGTRCVLGLNGTPYIAVYDTTTSPWTKMSEPSSRPGSASQQILFNSSGTRCVTRNSSSYTTYGVTNGTPQAYKTNGLVQGNTNIKYGIAKANASANANVSVDIVLNN